MTIAANELLTLARNHPHLGFKIESKPPGPLISALLQGSDVQTAIYIGNAGFQLLEGLQRGAIGVMPGASLTDVYVRIVELYWAGKQDEATDLHNRLLPLLNSIRQSVEQIIQAARFDCFGLLSKARFYFRPYIA